MDMLFKTGKAADLEADITLKHRLLAV